MSCIVSFSFLLFSGDFVSPMWEVFLTCHILGYLFLLRAKHKKATMKLHGLWIEPVNGFTFSLGYSNTEPDFADFQRIVPVFRPESDPSFSAEPPNPEPFRTLWVLPNSRIFYDRLLSYNLLLSAKSVIYPSSKNSSKCHVCCCCPVCPCIHFYSFTIILATFW